VLSTDGELSAESSVSSVDASGKVTEWKPERAPAPQPQISSDRNSIEGAGIPRAPEPESRQARAEPAPQVPPPAPAPAVRAPEPAAPVARTEPLPQTASPLALSALIGMLSLAGAAGMRFLR